MILSKKLGSFEAGAAFVIDNAGVDGIGGRAPSMPGRPRVGSSKCAAVMKFFQMRAGKLPPVTRFIGALSSFPTQTPATRSAV